MFISKNMAWLLRKQKKQTKNNQKQTNIVSSFLQTTVHKLTVLIYRGHH